VIGFDAHRADFANRLALLEALATVDLAGKAKLRAAIKVLQKDRDEKLDSVARIMIDLLSDVLPLKISEPLRDPLDAAKEREALEQRFSAESRGARNPRASCLGEDLRASAGVGQPR
jgi:hypothetical protein